MLEFKGVLIVNRDSTDIVEYADMCVLRGLIITVQIGVAPIVIKTVLSVLGQLPITVQLVSRNVSCIIAHVSDSVPSNTERINGTSVSNNF